MLKKNYQKTSYKNKSDKMFNVSLKTKLKLSILTIVACFTALSATTFAWFSSLSSVSVSSITAAEYALTVEIDGENVGNASYGNPITTCFSLKENDEHSIVLIASGSASFGYCIIEIDGQTYRTVSINQNDNITITVIAASGEEVKLSAYWGEHEEEQDLLENNVTLNISSTPFISYTVEENVTLEQIAEYYQVSASDILLYNGISELTVGDEIKIPNSTVTEPLVIQNKVDDEENIEDDLKQEDVEDSLTSNPNQENNSSQNTSTDELGNSSSEENKSEDLNEENSQDNPTE